jgi:hypothetical protein
MPMRRHDAVARGLVIALALGGMREGQRHRGDVSRKIDSSRCFLPCFFASNTPSVILLDEVIYIPQHNCLVVTARRRGPSSKFDESRACLES